MAVAFDEGRYIVRFIDQKFIEQDAVNDAEAFVLFFKVVRNLDSPQAPIGDLCL
jgi:hypothetical protein